MDVRIFHFVEGPDRNYKAKDYLNGRTGLIACRLLEWSGWYSQDTPQRLLGHYRLYQRYRSGMKSWPQGLSPARSYILHYKATHPFKYALARCASFLYSLVSWKEPFTVGLVAEFNHRLIRESSGILEEFLVRADDDFENAIYRALVQIRDSSFFQDGAHRAKVLPSIHLFQTNHLHQDNSSVATYNQINIAPVLKEGAKGKEKGVFSKRQILIMIDLLSSMAKMEGIDLSKPNRFDVYTDLLQAITGRGKATLLEELNNYRNKDLYAFNTTEELNQLIITMTNLGETFRKAGFKSFSKRVDQKIIELEQKGRK